MLSIDAVKKFMEKRYRIRSFHIIDNQCLVAEGIVYKVIMVDNTKKPFINLMDNNIDYYVIVNITNNRVYMLPTSTLIATFKPIIRINPITKIKSKGIDFNINRMIHNGFIGYIKETL